MPASPALPLELLRYTHESRDAAELGVNDREVALPEQYRDEHRDEVLKLVQRKIEADRTTPPSPGSLDL